MRTLALLFASTLLVACVATPDQSSQRELRQAEYERFAGEPVQQILVQRLYGWSVLDSQQVML